MPDHPQLSVIRQCQLLGITRSSFYHCPQALPANADQPIGAVAGTPDRSLLPLHILLDNEGSIAAVSIRT